jgi:hypothetical protein
MTDWAKESLKADQIFTRDDAARWFARHYPKLKGSTVNMHVDVMSINNPLRKHYPNIKPGSGHDLFYKLGPDEFRLWKQDTDPAPRYKQDLEEQVYDDPEQRRRSQSLSGIRKLAAESPELTRPLSPARTGDKLNLDLSDAVVLLSCVKSKLPYPAPARSLYTSTWFRKTRDIVEGSGAKWFVLSSLYGLVAPDAEIALYDYTLNAVGIRERRQWAKNVLGISFCQCWLVRSAS